MIPRAGWEEAKDAIMREIVRQKFRGNPELLGKLTATGSLCLINGRRKREKEYILGSEHNHVGR